MDPLDALAQDLGLWGLMGPGGMPQGPILVPAPEDPPFREAFIIDREHSMHRFEGFLMALYALTLVIWRWGIWWLINLCLWSVYWFKIYLYSKEKVTVWNKKADLRARGRLIEPPADVLYKVQAIPSMAELY
jgi:hypothetical protein